MEALSQLVYMSNSSENFYIEADIDNILRKASGFNTSHNITGLLIYKGGVFVQLLEGSKVEIESLIEKIATDKRHENLKVIYEGTSKSRIFNDWTMAYRRHELYNTDTQEQIEDFLKVTNGEEYIVNSEQVVNLLKNIRYSF
jgi:hypothetical protein